MASVGNRSIPALLAEAARGLRDLLGGELTLFRTELSQGIQQLGLGLTLLVGAAVFAIVGLFTLLLALVKAIAVLLQSDALAASIVGGVFALVALVLGLVGRSKASLTGLEPERTGRQLRQDVQVIKDRVDA